MRLEPMGLSEGKRILIVLFTKKREKMRAHYDKHILTRGRFRCNGSECVACAAGISIVKHMLLPVYDVDSGKFKIFHFTASDKPNSIWFKLRRAINHNNLPFCLELEGFQFGDAKLYLRDFLITDRFPKQEAKVFLTKIESGKMDYGDINPVISNKKLKKLKYISGKLPVMGDRCKRSAPQIALCRSDHYQISRLRIILVRRKRYPVYSPHPPPLVPV